MCPDEFCDYIKIREEDLRAKVKNELYANLQVWDGLLDGSHKITVDKIARRKDYKLRVNCSQSTLVCSSR